MGNKLTVSSILEASFEPVKFVEIFYNALNYFFQSSVLLGKSKFSHINSEKNYLVRYNEEKIK